MQVIINALPLLSPRSGIGNYIYQTFNAVTSIKSNWNASYYYGTKTTPYLENSSSKRTFSARKYVRSSKFGYFLSRNAFDLLFKIGQRKSKNKLYHETNYVPMPFDGPTIVTIFDLSFHLYPQTHPQSRIEYMKRYFYPRLEFANHFITISESTKKEMVQYLGIPKDKVSITPLGVDHLFNPFWENKCRQTLCKYNLKQNSYVLYVGTIEPRKNIINLIKAYSCLPSILRRKFPLVLAGGMGWNMESLNKTIKEFSIEDSVIQTGYFPSEDLPSLYRGATIFVYPSLYEGFGLPPLEAMASGVPVITSNCSSIIEVVGKAGIIVDPLDIKQLSVEIEDLLINEERRYFFRQKGIRRAEQFTWLKCAEKTLDVYSHVI